MGTYRRASRAIVLAAALAAAEVRADGPAPDFTDLDMEQLMDVELVYAAARHAQSLRDAPSAVTVVSASEIRRQGYRTLGDLLRALPSFYVTSDRNYSYIGVRGFGRPGDYNSRVLLLLNGVRVNDNVYASMYVGNDAIVDLDLVDRVEVVRGPAASLYGNSAIFAVVNVVTRRGADLAGGEVTAAAGSLGSVQGRASYGRKLQSGLDFVVSATALQSDGADLFFPEFDRPDTGRGLALGLDGEAAHSGFLSASWRGLSLHAAHSWRRKDVPTGAFDTIFGSPDNRTWDQQAQVALQYDGKHGRTDVAARAYHGRYGYRGHYDYTGEGAASVYADSCDGQWWTLETSAARSLGRHLFTVGAESQWNTRQDQGGATAGLPANVDVRNSGRRWAVYAQDEYHIRENLRLHAGVRHDTFGSYGQRTSPRVALVHTSGVGTLKLLFGTAFRAPNEYELHYFAPAATLHPETIRTLEAVWERPLGRDGRMTLAAFDNDISRLITLTGEGAALSFVNAGDIQSRGLEAMAEWRRPQGVRGRASYAFQMSTELDTGRELTNSPRHMAKLEVEVPLLSRRVWAGVNGQYMSRRLTLDGQQVDGFTRINLTLTAPRVIGRIDLSAGVSNVLGVHYADPGSEEHRQDAIAQDGRAFRVRALWKF